MRIAPRQRVGVGNEPLGQMPAGFDLLPSAALLPAGAYVAFMMISKIADSTFITPALEYGPMSPDALDATQAPLGFQCETTRTVHLDDGFHAQEKRFGHLANLHFNPGLRQGSGSLHPDLCATAKSGDP